MASTPTRRRVIVDTDAKNEADDQFAIVHALLSPDPRRSGLIAAHFGTRRSDRSMAESRDEIDPAPPDGARGAVWWPTAPTAASPTTTPRWTAPGPA